MQKLQGKTILITWGNSGIWYETAKLFVQEGARVVITGRDKDTLLKAKDTLGENVITIMSDVMSSQDRGELVDVLRQENILKLDVIFYNAWVANFIPIEHVSEEFFDTMMDTNFKGAFFTVQKLLPLLQAWGSVIFTGSVASHLTFMGNGVYGASKSALQMFAKTLAVEYAHKKIRANVISPGPTLTPIHAKMWLTQEQLQAVAAQTIPKIPLGRFAEASEVAKAALFLASDESSYITGSEIVIDGGTSIIW